MSDYKSPQMLSYNCDRIKDVIGPCQTAGYTTSFRITGGWDSAYNNTGFPNIQTEYSVTDVRLAHQDIKTLNRKKV